VPAGPTCLPADLGRGVWAGFTTRTGGVSASPYDTLNLADHVGDDPAATVANRTRLAASLGLAVDRLVFVRQVHGDGVLAVDGCASVAAAEADALVTAEPGLAVCVLVADCLPILLADPVAGVVAAAHAGRRGLVTGVVQRAVDQMERLGSSRERIAAAIGPAVCGRCYELPEEMARDVEAAVPESYTTTYAGTPAADLRAGATRLLRTLGVQAVQLVGGCTVEEPQRYFSHRRDGATGRLAGVILRR
jgi:polyphenol oxidase